MWVTIGSGEGEGLSVRVEGERFLVGSGEECQLMVRGPGVEPLHAYFHVREDGRVELHDLGTNRGTFVDGARVEGAVPIDGGEEIRVGDTMLRPTVEDPAEEVRQLHENEPGPADPAAVVRVETEGQTVEVLPGDDEEGDGEDASTVRVTTEGEAVEVVPARERRRLTQMTRRAMLAATGALALAALALALVLALGGDDEKSVADIVADATPQTVLVRVRAQNEEGGGSGFVYDADRGLVVTNFHVVGGATDFRIGVDEQSRPASIVAASPCDDLALLKVDDTDGLKTMELTSQDDVAQGDEVVALGYPANASLEDNLTSTAGTVSVVKSVFRLPDPAAPPLDNVVQIDVSLSPGNSGGPLVDRQGKLVGVNTVIVTRIGNNPIQGQGYAIGVDRVKEVVGELARGRSRGWAGFGVQAPPPGFLRKRRLPPGVVAGLPAPGTAAAQAGVGGVLLVAVNGRPVDGTIRGYCAAVSDVASGETAELTVIDKPGGRPKRVAVPFE